MFVDPAWYADSGASAHVTNDEHNLQNKQLYTGNEGLVVGNGKKLPIKYIGNTSLCTLNKEKLSLRNVLCVAEIEKNLLSISQLIVSNRVDVLFYSFGCIVKDKTSGKTLLLGT